jgi:hypothetical protein
MCARYWPRQDILSERRHPGRNRCVPANFFPFGKKSGASALVVIWMYRGFGHPVQPRSGRLFMLPCKTVSGTATALCSNEEHRGQTYIQILQFFNEILSENILLLVNNMPADQADRIQK